MAKLLWPPKTLEDSPSSSTNASKPIVLSAAKSTPYSQQGDIPYPIAVIMDSVQHKARGVDFKDKRKREKPLYLWKTVLLLLLILQTVVLVSRMRISPHIIGVMLGISTCHASYSDCSKCEPHQKCWPSFNEWSKLNKTVSGGLQVLKPLATSCHLPNFNTETCEAVRELQASRDWRVTQPEARLFPQFEASHLDRESCYMWTSKEDQCKQGSVPLYSIKALSTSDIIAGVNFARKHNIRLVIRNTGHDFLGRSSGRNSLQIWTGNIKGIEFSENWKAKGCRKHKTEKGEYAMTIGAGIQLYEMNNALAKIGRAATGGFARSVGAAGGFIHGGGHGPLGPLYGQSTDSALEFEIVTADGRLVTANACQNTDLFWALRGGGGGTFGITTHVTMRTFPDPTIVRTFFTIVMPPNQIWPILDLYHALAPTFANISTYSLYWAIPDSITHSSLTILALTPNVTSTTPVETFFAPFLDSARALGGSVVNYNSTHHPSTSTFLSNHMSTDSPVDNLSGAIPSRLISASFLSNPSLRPSLLTALKALPVQQNTPYLGHVVSGGAVARNAHLDTALNPAWRKAALHVIVPTGWADVDGVSWEEKDKVLEEMQEGVKLLKGLEPEMGAYGNEGNLREEGWQDAFWGGNYEKLLKVKKKWDRDRLFVCNRCVGSEGCKFY